MSASNWLKKISYCQVHPGIGVARVGNSDTDFFIAPEVPNQLTGDRHRYKDRKGRVKPQAARFRIYAYDVNGDVLGELTNECADIQWCVRLANRKAALRGRNVSIAGTSERDSRLVIDSGPRSIDSKSTRVVPLDPGKFRGSAGQAMTVELGRLKVDDGGRLLVIGSRGHAASVVQNNPATTDSNDDWCDDTGDGPVSAQVHIDIDGAMHNFDADPGWVVVAPPDYAPDVLPLIDLYQAIDEVNPIDDSHDVTYAADIYPLLRRVLEFGWVSDCARRGHGRGAPADFDLLGDDLAEPTPKDAAAVKSARRLRKQVFAVLRKPLAMLDMSEPRNAALARKQATAMYMPPMPGDRAQAKDGVPESWLSYLPRQYKKFERWANGEFIRGALEQTVADDLASLPVSAQPQALQQSALQRCVGGGFNPGYEVSRVVLDPKTYRAPFRIRRDMQPGSLTQHLELPWQLSLDNRHAGRWPSQVPVDVVPEPLFNAANASPHDSDAQVGAVLDQRENWSRGFGVAPIGWRFSQGRSTADVTVNKGDIAGDFIRYWSELGFVRTRYCSQGERAVVESERHPYAGLSARRLYHGLLNGNKDPVFLDKAKEYVESVLQVARSAQGAARHWEFFDCIKPFTYSESMLDARLKDIYNDAMLMAVRGTPYRPEDDPIGTKELTVERIRQYAPFNLVDGSWLRNIKRLGPADDVNVLLGRILDDEMGNGISAQNHASIYQQTCHSVGYYPKDIRSDAFCFDPTLLSSAFENPAFQLSISEFTDDYYPEIIGMTLYLEWTVLSLKPIAEKLRYFGIDTHYFDMHLAIDNASEGHGKIAVDAIKLYMSNITALTGERGAQSVWRRIWDGFAAFSIMQDYLGDSVTAGLAATADVEAQVVDLIAAKKEYGALNHHGHVLGGWRINDLFNEPHLFLGKLADSKFIVKGKPDESPFFRLLQPDGCMFGVFSSDEIALLEKWVRSLEGRASVGVSDQRIEPEIPVLPFHPRQPAIAPAEYLS